MTTLLLTLALTLVSQVPPELADGMRLVDEGDLAGGVASLEPALLRLAAENGPARERALGYLYLGMAQLGLDRAVAARASLREAWRLNPGARLDPMRFPPRVVKLYQEVGQEARAPGEAPNKKTRPKRTVAIAAGVGVALGAGFASLGNGSPAAPPAPVPQVSQSVGVRLFNNDDAGRVFLNGALVRQAALGEDSGLVDVSSLLASGSNEIAFELVNDHGGITYGFEVRVGDAIVFQETCGIVFRAGCENDQKFPAGVVRRFTYQLQR
jgi:hypothetical protein